MARFYQRILSTTAGSLSLLLLAGCPNAGTQPPIGGTGATAMPSAGPSSATGASNGSGASSTSSSASSSPNSTTSPTAVPSSSPLATTTVKGTVYDETGAPVTTGTVHVVSLNSSNPFDSTVNITGGTYVVNSLPAGVQLQITATQPNWTSRTRVVSLLPLSSAQPNTINFGGPFNDTSDPQGPGYFISRYPEVVSVNPGDGSYVDPSKVTYQVTLSEPLDANNRALLANSLLLQANNLHQANNNQLFIQIQNGSVFLNDTNTAQVSWNSTNTVMTLTFNAPLCTSSSSDQIYTVNFNRASGAPAIQDPQGNPFGMTSPAAGNSYTNVIAFGSPSLTGTETTASARWNATHASSVTFKLKQDQTAPVLASVSDIVSTFNNAPARRFDLKFSKPMRAYPDSASYSTTCLSLNNYIFALSQTSLSGTTMPTTTTTKVTSASDAQADMSAVTPFTFDPTSGASVVFSTTDPTVISVFVPQTVIPTQTQFFKVEAINIKDPAGNGISTANTSSADATADNIKQGNL